jgi:uncharacterized RDD family membrane protein YckC
MFDDSQNPYAAPSSLPGGDFGRANYDQDVLAGRFTRFAAAFVDGILTFVVLGPIYYATGFINRAMRQEVGVVEQLLMTLVSMGIILLLNGYLLASRGQTIGKFLTKIQIIDYQSSKLVPFLKLYVFRYLWLLPLTVVVALIPGALDDNLVNLVALIDALLIFGAARRCLHDLIAGTKVVEYRPNRAFVNA